MLLTLLACACPTFEEMEVVAVDASATQERVDEISDALADFAAWTGDVGVCVPQIQVKEDLEEPWGLADGYEVGGQFRGKHQPIRIDSDSDNDVGESLWQSTLHELCHASDHLEGHSDAMTFPETADREVITGEHIVREDFAIACQEGPVDFTLDAAVADICGTAPRYGEDIRYIADVVFPEAPRIRFTPGIIPLTVTRHVWSGLSAEADVEDAIAVGDEVAILVDEDDADGESSDLYIRVFDATLGEVRRELVLAPGARAADGRFIRSDDGRLYVQIEVRYGGTALELILEVDLEAGSARVLPIPDATDLGNLTISGGVLYATRDDDIVAWTLEGEPVALELPWNPYITAIWPEPEGFGYYTFHWLGRYDAATGDWTYEPAPEYVYTRTDLGGGRIFAGGHAGTSALVYDDGAYRIAGDPCARRSWGSDWRYNHIVVVDGHIWAIDRDPGAWDDDGDGVYSRYIDEIVFD